MKIKKCLFLILILICSSAFSEEKVIVDLINYTNFISYINTAKHDLLEINRIINKDDEKLKNRIENDINNMVEGKLKDSFINQTLKKEIDPNLISIYIDFHKTYFYLYVSNQENREISDSEYSKYNWNLESENRKKYISNIVNNFSNNNNVLYYEILYSYIIEKRNLYGNKAEYIDIEDYLIGLDNFYKSPNKVLDEEKYLGVIYQNLSENELQEYSNFFSKQEVINLYQNLFESFQYIFKNI
jgi:hypothetical protein